MSTISIVGSEEAKFTPATELKARELIRYLIEPYDRVVSGRWRWANIPRSWSYDHDTDEV